MSATPAQDAQISAFIDRWGVPFARALAEFVRSATEVPAVNSNKSFDVQSYRRSTGHASFAPLSRAENPSAYAHLDGLLAEHQPKKGATVIFDSAYPAKRAGNRLKEAFRSRGIKQTAIARKLKMAPSVLSRILQNPERSRLDTIQRIAHAAGIPLAEIL